MVTIKRVDVLSAMKVGALLSGFMFAVFGVLILGLQSWMLTGLTASSGYGSAPYGSNFAMVGLAGCLVTYVMGVVFSAVFGAIGGAAYAFFYNVIANWVGGLRVELDYETRPVSKAKRVSSSADEFEF